MKKVLIAIFSLMVIVSLVMAGCGPAEEKPTTPTAPTTPTTPAVNKYGGTYVTGDYRVTQSLGFPALQMAGYGKRQAMPAIETLLHLDASGKTVPWLAESWKLDPTASTITLTLRKGVKFHDGTDFNAAAVKWNLDKCAEKRQFGTNLIKSVDALDDSTVRINLEKWDNTLLDMLGYQYIGMMMSPAAYEKNGEEWCQNNMVGTGPFKQVSWEKEVKITFEKNANYWQTGKPYLNGIEDVIIADRTVGMLAFKAGETDDIIEPLAQDIVPAKDAGYNVHLLPFAAFCSTMGAAQLDGADPNSPFADERVRIACQYAINTKEINDTVLYGLGWGADEWLPVGHWAYVPEIAGIHSYNPAKAKELLAAAGYGPGGKALKIKDQYSTTPEADLAHQAIQSYFKDVGIELELIPMTNTALKPIWTEGGTWDGMIFSGPPPYPDAAAGFRDRFCDGDKYYSEMLVPADYKQAVDNAVTAGTWEDKVKWTKEANKLYTEKALGLYFYSQPKVMIEQPYLHDSGMFRVATDSQWTPEDCWVETPKVPLKK